MINNTHFQIIGRIGNINTSDKVTHISIASDRSVKGDDGNWTEATDWNSVTVFAENIRKRLGNEKIGKKGNRIIVQGNIQQSTYKKDGETIYTTNLIVKDFDVLSFAKDGE